ncbi:LNS2-domain-containing protein [Metschnikowia bicuspidata]|uniref:LNS2-domain-containing protein n=1 Tax=Metschnikowia bicuspidata TaxID=27322 RepID=A0A4P9ZGL0_9ASCO|nr:LNS2-domain-containing protein [Metschnikowia bicuspidata]
MQYVGRVGDYVYSQWNSLNPATLSGAIDILVVERPDGTLHCSPWHVRFGKFQIIKPLDKKIDVYVNGTKTDLPMKLGEGGEAFFVFETESSDLSQSMVTSPVISAVSSPYMSPDSGTDDLRSEPETLDLNLGSSGAYTDSRARLTQSLPALREAPPGSPHALQITFEKVTKISKKLNIPSKVDINGDVVLDMDGYEPSAEKNIALSDKLVHEIFLKELLESFEFSEHGALDLGKPGFTQYDLLESVIKKDEDGCIRIITKGAESDVVGSDTMVSLVPASGTPQDKVYFKTLRLTSAQLSKMKLQFGPNRLKFRLSQGTSQIESDLYLWKSTTPIVISDIDGTITKSDALGHVLNMFGKDWTHQGVATLFLDISKNGYNIIYLTARSAGQADTTRQYLNSINQDGVNLPKGPVILSPDRTMAALRREIILKNPEVFKMVCLRDIKSLFFQKIEGQNKEDDADDAEDDHTPFYAGFGNRITDAISYRSVHIPSHRIFTINPDGEVHMELLELAGYRSTYLRIGELVDQFFPPLKYITDFNDYWDKTQLDNYMNRCGSRNHDMPLVCPGSPPSINSAEHVFRPDEKFTDLNFWRENLKNLSDLSDVEDDDTDVRSSPGSLRMQLLSSSTFSSPLNTFMLRKKYTNPEPKPMKTTMQIGQEADADMTFDDDEFYTDDYDYTSDEQLEEADAEIDEENDVDDVADEGEEEDDELDDEDVDEESDEDADEAVVEAVVEHGDGTKAPAQTSAVATDMPTITTASEMMKTMKIQ